MKKKNKLFSFITTNLWLILIIAFIYLPIIYVVIFSFNGQRSLTELDGFSLQWYQRMFSNKTMLEAIYYTVLVAVVATIVSTIIGTITAIGLSKQKKVFREIVLQINNLPVMNPDIVTAIGLMLLFISLNIEKSIWTLLIAHITFCIPYVILSIMPKLRTLDDNVAEAALDLGATPWQALTKVILPQIMPAIISGALIAFSMSFDDFVISFFTTGTGVSNISIYVYSMSKRINPSINAMSSIIVLVVTTILILVNILPEKKNTDVVNNKKGKAVLPIVLSFCLIAALVIPGIALKSNKSGIDPIALYGTDELNVFNAGEYIDDETLSLFEEKYGVRVNYDTFDSNEAMYTKLMGGTKYDILVPSDYMIERLIEEDMLLPIDYSIVDNMDLINPDVLGKPFDPENKYTVPYFWGSVGIIYDTTIVDSADVEEMGWDIFISDKYQGQSYMYDSERDVFMIAFKALGYSMNTSDPQEIEDAYQWLIKMKTNLQPSIVTDEVIDGMANGDKALAIVYSGDAAYICSENENMAYYEPYQGTNIWVDGMIIPKTCQAYDLANEFIKFMIEYDNAYMNSAYVGYTAVNKQVAEDLANSDYEGIDAYIPRANYELDESFEFNLELSKKISDLWVKVKIH